MFNKYIIKFILLFKSVFTRFGVDAEQLRIILLTKLKMDDRRPNVYNQQRQKKKKETNNSSWLTMLMLVFMGAFMAILLAIAKQPYIGHTIYFSAFMVMLAVTLISDFTSVLIDVRDNYIILPRPVSNATFTVSRILHIGIHTTKMSFSIALGGILYSFIFDSLASGFMFILEVFIATLLSIFIVNIIYLVVLKVTSPQKFKDFISYFQIFFSVAIFAAYYTLPKLLTADMLNGINILDHQLLTLLPPVWLAALHELATNFSATNWVTFLLAFVAIITPFISLYLVVKVLAPGFNQKLSAISGSGEEGNVISSEGKGAARGFMNKIAKILAPDSFENAGFKITWLLSSRYRDFKVKVYPAFAYVPVYFIYFGFINGKGSFSDKWADLLAGNMYILLIYLTSFVLTTVLQHISMTEKYKASWIFYSAPLQNPGKILAGMFKAVIVKYYLPYFLLIGVFNLVFWGPQVLNDLILAFMVGIIYGLLIALFQVKGFPFSQPVNLKQTGKVFIGLFIFIIPVALGFLHYWAAKWEIVIWISAAILTLATAFAFSQYKKESWDSLEMAD